MLAECDDTRLHRSSRAIASRAENPILALTRGREIEKFQDRINKSRYQYISGPVSLSLSLSLSLFLPPSLSLSLSARRFSM